jgi:glutaredoxin
MEIALPVHKGASFYIKRITGFILLTALAAVFFYSAYSKIYSDNAFDNFQWTFLDLGINSIFATGIIARLLIGFEVLLGLFLLAHIFLRSFTYKAVIAVLAVFIVYLLIVLLKQGNTGNCGCFGDKLAMKPLTAIWKNLIMIAVTVLLMYIYPVRPYRHQEYISLFLGMAAFSLPYIINPIYTGSAPEKYAKPINLDPLYKYTPAPLADLRKGKHIVAFMSLTCPHCKKAAYLLQIIHREHPDIPVFIVLDGSETFLKKFFDDTHAENVPYLYYRHADEFREMAGPGVPAIYWVNNGIAEYKSVYAYYQLDPKYMEQWLTSGLK